MKRWTDDVQQSWLEDKAHGFVQAQLDTDVGPHMSLLIDEWLEEFPDSLPLDSEIRKKDLAKAKGVMGVAKVEKKKNVSGEIIRIDAVFDLQFSHSNCSIGFITFCVIRKLKEKGRRQKFSSSRKFNVPGTYIAIRDFSTSITRQS